jgi:hypothetical protein
VTVRWEYGSKLKGGENMNTDNIAPSILLLVCFAMSSVFGGATLQFAIEGRVVAFLLVLGPLVASLLLAKLFFNTIKGGKQ